nr:sodium/hydrogen exchanger 1 [Quercus suber]
MAVLETIPVLLSSSSSSSSFLDTSTVIALTVFFALLCACIIIGHLLEENRWANESITALLLGLCCGVVVLLIRAYLLFKRTGVISLDIQDYLAVGAILSATDSVCTLQVLNQDETPLLYSIVFGEGVVNDATSIVLFNAVQSLDVSNIDLLTALKLLGTFLYLFFTSTALETFIFLYIGMDALDIDKWKSSKASPGTSIAVSSTLFALVLVGRAAFVFPIANITNCVKNRPSTKIELWKQFANSDKTLTEDNALMITSTIIVVLFSTIVFGSITKPLIKAMLLRNAKPAHSDATDIPSLDDLQILFLENGDPSDQGGSNEPTSWKGSLSLLISNPTPTVHYFWRKFDDKFTRPVFIGRGFVPFVPSSPTGVADPQTSQYSFLVQ